MINCHAIPEGNARYCECCGYEKNFFQNNLLDDWETERREKEERKKASYKEMEEQEKAERQRMDDEWEKVELQLTLGGGEYMTDID